DVAGAAEAPRARRARLRRRDAGRDGVRAARAAPRARALGRRTARARPPRRRRALRRPPLGRQRRARAPRRGAAPGAGTVHESFMTSPAGGVIDPSGPSPPPERYPPPSCVPSGGSPMALKNVVLVDAARSAFARGAKGKLVATRLDEAGATVLRA